MREPRAWLLCLLLLGLALRGAASRAHHRSMETRSECRDPSPAVSARHPRATPHLGIVPAKWPSSSSSVLSPEWPCPARIGGVHFPTREVWGGAGSAHPGTRMGGGKGAGPWSWGKLELSFPKATPPPQKWPPQTPGAPPYGSIQLSLGDGAAASRACACALGPALGRVGAQGAHGRRHASVTALAVPLQPRTLTLPGTPAAGSGQWAASAGGGWP